VISREYPSKKSHEHFEVVFQSGKVNDNIEIIYNTQFGQLPPIRPGSQIAICGDYITSNAPTSQYQASPDGAIIHWVHRSNNPRKHATGYLVVNGSLYGGFIPPAQPTN
jgi:hypothetical protein